MMKTEYRQPTLDDFAPKMRFQFPDGAILTIGTKRDDDDALLYGVHLVFSSGKSPEPEMNILLPPHSVDIMIPVLEDMANQARFIMGSKTVDYPQRPQAKKQKRNKPANQAMHRQPGAGK